MLTCLLMMSYSSQSYLSCKCCPMATHQSMRFLVNLPLRHNTATLLCSRNVGKHMLLLRWVERKRRYWSCMPPKLKITCKLCTCSFSNVHIIKWNCSSFENLQSCKLSFEFFFLSAETPSKNDRKRWILRRNKGRFLWRKPRRKWRAPFEKSEKTINSLQGCGKRKSKKSKCYHYLSVDFTIQFHWVEVFW